MPKKVKTKEVTDLANESDRWSVMSMCSSEDSNFSELDNETQFSNPLDKIESEIEKLRVKRPETRIKYLKTVIQCLQSAFLNIDSSWNYHITLTDGLVLCIENNTGMDSIYSAETLSLLSFQYPEDDLEDMCENLHSKLLKIIKDSALPVKLRSECASAISNLIWMSGWNDYGIIMELMNELENIFKCSCLKGDGKTPVFGDQIIEFHENALYSWYRILLNLPNNIIVDKCQKTMPLLISILRTNCISMRICAAEVIALLYEQIRALHDESFKGPWYRDLVESIRDFSVENFKNKSKNDLKKQRITMRHVLDYILSFKNSRTKVKFSNFENLELTDLEDHFRYDSLCDALKIGLNKHLKTNPNVREIFSLGLPLMSKEEQTMADRKLDKNQKKFEHQMASKIRKEYVNKNRSFKSDVHNSFINDE